MKWSKSTGWFYEAGNPNTPSDAVDVSDDEHASLLAAEGRGKKISADDNGRPIAVDPPLETQSDALIRALAGIRTQRAPMLDALAGIAGRAQRIGDTTTADAADAAAVNLLDITALPALLAAQTYDEMKSIVLAEYRRISDTAPATVQSAFVEVLG